MPATLENTHKKYDKSALCCDCCCNLFVHTHVHRLKMVTATNMQLTMN